MKKLKEEFLKPEVTLNEFENKSDTSSESNSETRERRKKFIELSNPGKTIKIPVKNRKYDKIKQELTMEPMASTSRIIENKSEYEISHEISSISSGEISDDELMKFRNKLKELIVSSTSL